MLEIIMAMMKKGKKAAAKKAAKPMPKPMAAKLMKAGVAVKKGK